ncbi:twin-arginine translocase subunit TatC [Microbacterium sp. cx-59]|uniref:twin-arginine translocase subunit TatC n=1 Tax=Microbacterium sp. cx-59 TaxID=2891207 RepID=UPI0027E1F233|nr:twin-arginine translocase subunit TatC [Microbacterium sp. cx-59]
MTPAAVAGAAGTVAGETVAGTEATERTAGERMPLAAHAREARTRLTRATAALAIAVVLGFVASDGILDVLRAPIDQLAESRAASLNFDSVTGAFDLRIRIAVVAGAALSSPVWLYEILAYLAPGLTRREKRYTFGFVFAALPLFAAGCLTGLVLFPHMVELLAGFASAEDSSILQASYYVDFVIRIVLCTGIAFVLPVLLVALNFAGILPARAIAHRWRIIVVVIVLFSALATPAADVLSMFFVAIPVTALFGGALGIAFLRDRRAARAASASL